MTADTLSTMKAGLVPANGTLTLDNTEYAIVSDFVLQALVEAAIYERALTASEVIISGGTMPDWVKKWTAYSITLSLRQLKDVDGRPLFIPHTYNFQLNLEGVRDRVHNLMAQVELGEIDLPASFVSGTEVWFNEVEGKSAEAITYYPDTGVTPFISATASAASVKKSLQPVANIPVVGAKFLLPE